MTFSCIRLKATVFRFSDYGMIKMYGSANDSAKSWESVEWPEPHIIFFWPNAQSTCNENSEIIQNLEKIVSENDKLPKSNDIPSDMSTEGKQIFELFKKIFEDLEWDQIHHYHICSAQKCQNLHSDSSQFTSDNKFQHKWLFDPSLAQCAGTHQWCLVYIEGKGYVLFSLPRVWHKAK